MGHPHDPIQRSGCCSANFDNCRFDRLAAQKRLVEAGLGIALLSQSNAAEELKSGALRSIGVGDLTARHDVVAVTRRGGFLSAASRRLLDLVRARFRRTKSSGR